MAKYWLTAAAAGLAGALAWLAAYLGAMPGLVLSYLAPAPLFLAGLGLGGAGGVAAAAGGALLILAVGGPPGATIFVLTIAVPAVLLTRKAMLSRSVAADEEVAGAGATEWYPPGLLAAWLAGLGVAGLSAIALYLLSEPDGMQGTVAALTAELATAMEMPEPAMFSQVATPLLPGLMVSAWMVMLTLNGALAQTILVRAGRNLRPSPDIAALYLPGWIAPAGALAAAIGLLAPGDLGYFGRNLVAVLAVPFFFQGLAVVHALTRRSASGRPLLAIFYVLLIVLGWLVLLVAVLGLAEQIAGFRARLEKNGRS